MENLILWIKIFFAVAILIAVAFFLLRPIWRMWREKPDLDVLVPDFSNRLEGEEELQIPEGLERNTPERTEIISQARSDPQVAAMLVQQWLREKK